jgi:hypothetical protein
MRFRSATLLLPLALLACSGPVTREGTVLRTMEVAKMYDAATKARIAPLPAEEKTLVIPFGTEKEAELRVVFTRITEPGADPMFKDIRLEVGKNNRYEVVPGMIGVPMDMMPASGTPDGHRHWAIPLSAQFSWKGTLGSHKVGSVTATVHVDGTLANVHSEANR